jgi:hypothetical protein
MCSSFPRPGARHRRVDAPKIPWQVERLKNISRQGMGFSSTPIAEFQDSGAITTSTAQKVWQQLQRMRAAVRHFLKERKSSPPWHRALG